jgi:putative pyruvate formate lyase activating enzyme
MNNATPAEAGASWLDHLGCCESCPRRCGANRLSGEVGFCRVDAGIPVAHVGLHFGEEPPISGVRGSGTIFLAGCNLRCVFCQNSQISQETPPARFRRLAPADLAMEMRRLQDRGAHNINFVSPSHMVFQMAEAIRLARQAGLVIPVIYNSNGYDSVAALRRIRGLVDIYLPDLKYLDNALGKNFSGVDDYADVVPGVLREMLDQVGSLVLDAEGIAVRGVLVRHLVLPGCLDNSRRCLDFLAKLAADIPVSIMAQYAPRYRAGAYPEIDRRLSQAEYDQIVDHAVDLGLENAFIQELAAAGHYLPDFARDDPFGNAAPDLD